MAASPREFAFCSIDVIRGSAFHRMPDERRNARSRRSSCFGFGHRTPTLASRRVVERLRRLVRSRLPSRRRGYENFDRSCRPTFDRTKDLARKGRSIYRRPFEETKPEPRVGRPRRSSVTRVGRTTLVANRGRGSNGQRTMPFLINGLILTPN